MYTISKEFHFSASHVLYGLDDGHPCGRMHGHNYVIVVELQSDTLNDVGFVKDYRELDPIKAFIDDHLDHRHLNDILLYDGQKERLLFHGNPSAEIMAEQLYLIFHRMVPEVTAVTVKETPKTAATYRP
jgi:6-pyruvoyltetrahydropterin/6-carboxytetrahydropterin synthase